MSNCDYLVSDIVHPSLPSFGSLPTAVCWINYSLESPDYHWGQTLPRDVASRILCPSMGKLEKNFVGFLYVHHENCAPSHSWNHLASLGNGRAILRTGSDSLRSKFRGAGIKSSCERYHNRGRPKTKGCFSWVWCFVCKLREQSFNKQFPAPIYPYVCISSWRLRLKCKDHQCKLVVLSESAKVFEHHMAHRGACSGYS